MPRQQRAWIKYVVLAVAVVGLICYAVYIQSTLRSFAKSDAASEVISAGDRRLSNPTGPLVEKALSSTTRRQPPPVSANGGSSVSARGSSSVVLREGDHVDEELKNVTRPFQSPRSPVQQSDGQLKQLWQELNAPGPRKSLLVFGLGEDSAYLADVANAGGLTVFLEDNDAWIQKILSKYTSLKAHAVKYHTQLLRDVQKYEDRETWPQLAMQMPSEVADRLWDVVLVDAPLGDGAGPGRYQSIYMASKLTKEGGLIIVDDCERKVEDKYMKLLLGNIATQVYTVARGFKEHGSTGKANKQCGFRRKTSSKGDVAPSASPKEDAAPSTPADAPSAQTKIDVVASEQPTTS